jgi:hypothetical protein
MSNLLLVSALRNLAASADEQAAYLCDLGVAPSCDELALGLEDALKQPGLPPELEAAARDVDAQLTQMSGPESVLLWQVSSLKCAEAWDLVRRLAAKALDAGGYTQHKDE